MGEEADRTKDLYPRGIAGTDGRCFGPLQTQGCKAAARLVLHAKKNRPLDGRGKKTRVLELCRTAAPGGGPVSERYSSLLWHMLHRMGVPLGTKPTSGRLRSAAVRDSTDPSPF